MKIAKLTSSLGKLLLFIIAAAFLHSCVNTRSATYFDNIQNEDILIKLDSLEPIIKKNDLLSITISSPNPAATQVFNVSTTNTSSISSQATGYLVNQEGFVELPMLGPIKAAGLTKKQFKEDITKSIIDNQLLKSPMVAVRYLNYNVTVLGEVARPSVISVADEKISLLKALGYAGDMTMYAQRNNVMVIREDDEKRTVARLDLNSKELLSSPYYYLKPNDVVYVQPNKAKVSGASNVRGWMPMIISAVSLAAVILYRTTR